MANVAGMSKPLRRLSSTIDDKTLRAAVAALEDKLEELDRRLADAERRLTAGGL